MRNLFKSLSAFALAALLIVSGVAVFHPAPAAAQQYSYSVTTLSANVTAGQVSFGLASVTGISGQSTSTGTMLFIDRELVQVVSVNTTAKTVVVQRGVGGTQASPHKSGIKVIAASAPAFQAYDPQGTCTASATPASPWINYKTSNQWLCSSVVGVWVPGFGNPGVSGTPVRVTAAVTSASSITPSGPLFHVTGTTQIATITLPSAFTGGCFTAIMDGSGSGLTWTTGGNIAVAGTATTAGSSVTFCWDSAANSGNGFWYPSRLA